MPKPLSRATVGVLSALALSAAGVSAAPIAAADTPCSAEGSGFDIDGGGTDVVIGLPSYDVPTETGTQVDAGAIVVYSNVATDGDVRAPESARLYTAKDLGLSVQEGARFGADVLTLKPSDPGFTGCGHLLVGAPGEDVDGLKGAGAVHLIDGWGDGMRPAWSLDQSDLPDSAGPPQAGGNFGSRIGAATSSDIAVGVPGRDIGDQQDAGAVAVMAVDDKEGVGRVKNWLPGKATDDRMGSGPLVWAQADGSSTLGVGVPQADVGDVKDAGAVAFTRFPEGAPTTTWEHQDSKRAAGTAEPGDELGASISVTIDRYGTGEWLIGVPGEDLGTTRDAGMVAYANGGAGGDEGSQPVLTEKYLTQNSTGIAGTPEAGDRFGSSVAVGPLRKGTLTPQVIVGAEGESVGERSTAGALSANETDEHLVPTSTPGLAWSQDNSDIAGGAEPDDRFGAAMSTTPGGYTDNRAHRLVVVTTPGEDLGSTRNAGRATIGWFAEPGKKFDLVLPTSQVDAGTDMVAATYPTASLEWL